MSKSSENDLVVALWDFSPQQASTPIAEQSHKKRKTTEGEKKTQEIEQLTLRKGNIIQVSARDESGWWWGIHYNKNKKKTYGTAGWFPSSYVEDFLPKQPKEERPNQSWMEFSYNTGMSKSQALQTDKATFRGVAYLESTSEEQTSATRDFKTMQTFFDYEKWNQQMNAKSAKNRKPKPDKKMKKEKKIRW